MARPQFERRAMRSAESATTLRAAAEAPKRGDILVFHTPVRPGTVWRPGVFFTWMIQVCTRSRWNHAAIALGPDREMGVPMMVEAVTSEGVRKSAIASREAGDEMRSAAVDYQGDDREQAIDWALRRVGRKYGFVNAFMCGLRHLFPGAVVFKVGDQYICSELVAEALQVAGIDFGKDASHVAPGDVAEKLGLPRR